MGKIKADEEWGFFPYNVLRQEYTAEKAGGRENS